MQKVLPEPYIYLIEPEHYQNMVRDISVSAYMLLTMLGVINNHFKFTVSVH